MSTTLHHLGAGLAGVMLALLVSAPALAHAELVSTSPEDGEVLATPPTTVELRYSEGLEADKSSFRLVGPAGEIGTGTLNRDGGRILRLDNLALAPGAYTVKWTIGSADDHVERGTLRFTVSEPTPAPATPTPAPTAAGSAESSDAPTSEPPATPAPASAAPAGDAPSPSGADAEPVAATGTDVLIPIIAGLALVALAGTFLLRRSRGA